MLSPTLPQFTVDDMTRGMELLFDAVVDGEVTNRYAVSNVKYFWIG